MNKILVTYLVPWKRIQQRCSRFQAWRWLVFSAGDERQKKWSKDDLRIEKHLPCRGGKKVGIPKAKMAFHIQDIHIYWHISYHHSHIHPRCEIKTASLKGSVQRLTDPKLTNRYAAGCGNWRVSIRHTDTFKTKRLGRQIFHVNHPNEHKVTFKKPLPACRLWSHVFLQRIESKTCLVGGYIESKTCLVGAVRSSL